MGFCLIQAKILINTRDPLKKPGGQKDNENIERKIIKVMIESAGGPEAVTKFEWKAASVSCFLF